MIHYGMDSVSVNGKTLTPSNINNFDLHKVFTSEIADIYSEDKNSEEGRFILCVKNPAKYAESNSYLLDKDYDKRSSYVTWFEYEPLEELIGYIKNRLNN